MADKHKRRVTIPEGLEFSALRLRREPSGDVAFDFTVIDRICDASGIDRAVMHAGPEDNVAGLIVAWYARHLADGGEPDPVAEQLGAEVRAEDGYQGVE
jgi:hypothetical protein